LFSPKEKLHIRCGQARRCDLLSIYLIRPNQGEQRPE
jgi:hypothetical protein